MSYENDKRERAIRDAFIAVCIAWVIVGVVFYFRPRFIHRAVRSTKTRF